MASCRAASGALKSCDEHALLLLKVYITTAVFSYFENRWRLITFCRFATVLLNILTFPEKGDKVNVDHVFLLVAAATGRWKR